MSQEEARVLPWDSFVDRLPALCPPVSYVRNLQIVLTGKSVTWSDRDINVYVGQAGRHLRSYLDLNPREFAAVFGWHLRVATNLSARLHEDIYVTHGFNPQDNAPDAHSLNSRFHTHVHVPQVGGAGPVSRRQLSTFDRLSLIEPFSDVFYDRTTFLLTATQNRSLWLPERRFGFFSLVAPLGYLGDADALIHLYSLLNQLHVSYSQLVRVMSTGSEEVHTGYRRLVPRQTVQREALTRSWLSANESWISQANANRLLYLGRNLMPAGRRSPPYSKSITAADQLWLAKGFSGVLNFIISADQQKVKFDFAPRVISTSGAAKVLAPCPTIVRKDRGLASPIETQIMSAFHLDAVAATAEP